ncbi:MAG: hypothetical protein AAB225_10835 [Acidobacteriota bacterium]
MILPESRLEEALTGVAPPPVHGPYSRFVEFRHLATPASGAAPLWGMGSLFQQSTSGFTFERIGGGTPQNAGPIVVNIIVRGAKEFFEKETVRVVVENPRAVQSAPMTATKSNAGRREMTSLQFSPGLLTA